MTYYPVQSPYPIFTDEDGTPLEDGYIYIGEANQNPITNPITISWDAAGIYPATQPIRTIAGYPDRNGSASSFYVDLTSGQNDYSILVQDKKGVRVLYERTALSTSGITLAGTISIIDELRNIVSGLYPLYVRGHSAMSDGGEGTFEWTDGAAPATYVDDNGTIIVPTGGDGSGAWIRVDIDEFIHLKWFGPTGNGVVDDSTAIDNAETAAYTASKTLLFDAGKTYTYDGTKTFRCSISGYGATLYNIAAAEETNESFGSIRINALDDLFVVGITIDANFMGSGISLVSTDRITVRDCVASNCIHAGFRGATVTDTLFENCKAIGIKYQSDGTGAADGWYLNNCQDIAITDCHAEDFRRIGYVTEGGAGTTSKRIRLTSCLAKDANNCDDSTTGQYNTGFWAEHTDGIQIVNCAAIDIAGNAGQTSGRVRGLVLQAVSDEIGHINLISDCHIGDDTNTMINGITTEGTIDLATVLISNCWIGKSNLGISTLGGIDNLTIDNVTLFGGVYSAAGHGGIVINNSGGINTINIRNLIPVNESITNVDAATINIFASGTGDRIINITNSFNISFRAAGSWQETNISDCSLEYRTATYGMINALANKVTNCKITDVAGSNARFLLGSTAAADSKAFLNNCEIYGFSANLSSQNPYVAISDCYFEDTWIRWFPTTSSFLEIANCRWENPVLNQPCIQTNFYNGTDRMIVNGCSFNTIAGIPILKDAYDIDKLIITSSMYSGGAITDLVGGTLANNIAY